jgi:hypothetical protein
MSPGNIFRSALVRAIAGVIAVFALSAAVTAANKTEPAASAGGKTKPGAAARAPFQPPFPNRQEIFAPPEIGDRRALERGEARLAVVRGFIQFRGQRVVLEIGDEVRVLAEGDRHRGLEVIGIAPPNVTLRRGGTRWVEQLEHDTPGEAPPASEEVARDPEEPSAKDAASEESDGDEK